ncbi:conserved Plasmodium protein, unknown function [Plasmodium sp. gorilla clade G2]|uniref:conserved Plasmodium protein, unknown function n=1 Tax=Plasmodium sp. gorilla clade G2 TaxID=880535 RepID=UPI000D22C9FF|nr:conserved Plasmodium protein, unknown function [Plasmodium sp. gorilla clade G2]SOV11775.1 conserved Plasmodium protein, unknown function [Plasmodium sp. gorilla clade G2]
MAKLERKKFEARKKDGKLRTRKAGFSKFSYQANNRGKLFKFTPQKKKVDVRKHIFKQYGRSNLSMMNRKFNKRGGNSFFSKNKRKLANKFQDKSFGNSNGNTAFTRKFKSANFRNRRTTFRNNKKRNVFFRKNQNLHDKIGKLTSKDLDDELDKYMGSSNIKTRLDNDLDSYFKNNDVTQGDMNKGFNKIGE